jgi:hypothetical protein
MIRDRRVAWADALLAGSIEKRDVVYRPERLHENSARYFLVICVVGRVVFIVCSVGH